MSIALRRLAAMLLISASLPAFADTGWTRVTPTHAGPTILSLAASPTRFVALTDAGRLLWSDDGREWNAVDQTRPTPFVTKVVYGNGVFLAYGNYSNYLSTDGVSWTAVKRPPSGNNDMAFFNGRFIAGGAPIHTSTDGVTWTASATPGTFYIWTLAPGNGVILASGPQEGVLRSTDGLSWQLITSPAFAPGSHCVAWRGDAFINSYGFASVDGVSWAADLTNRPGISCGARDSRTVTVSDGTYMARAYNQNTAVLRWNGSTLVTELEVLPFTPTSSEIFYTMAAQGERLLVAGHGVMHIREPGGAWEKLLSINSVGGEEASQFMVENAGTFYAYTSDTRDDTSSYQSTGHIRIGHLLRSADSSTWTTHAVSGLTHMSALAAHGGALYASAGDTLYRSTDGIAWTQLRQMPWSVRALRSDGPRLVVLGGSAYQPWGIASTIDGTDWQGQDFTATSQDMRYLARGPNGWFVTSVEGALAATSADGAAWTLVTTTRHGYMDGHVSGSPTRLWRNMGGGWMQWSLDGLSWTSTATRDYYVFSEPVWDGARWLALGRPGSGSLNAPAFFEQTSMLIESADGEAWSVIRNTEQDRFAAILASGGTTLAFGSAGNILRRDITPALAPRITPGLSVLALDFGPNPVALSTLSGAPAGSTYELLFNVGTSTLTLDAASGNLTIDQPTTGSGGLIAFLVSKDGQLSNISTLSYSAAVGFADMSATLTTPKSLIKKTQAAVYTATIRNSSSSPIPGHSAYLHFGVLQSSKITSAKMVGGTCTIGVQAAYCYPTNRSMAPGASYTATIKVKPKLKGPLTAVARAYTSSRDTVPTNDQVLVTITVK